MLQVEVYIPSLDCSFEVEINEHATVRAITGELASLVEAQTGHAWADRDALLLCCQEVRTVLPRGKTAYQCKVKPGNRLLLL